jgi:hypothetical protein
MATAVLLLPLLGAGLTWAAGDVVSGNFRSWHVLAVNHLATLGWGTLTAMGALHQLFPAMLGASIRPDRTATVQFLLTLAGLTLMVAAFLVRSMPLVVLGGVITAAGVLLFAALLLRVIPRRRRWTLPATGAMLALGYLVLTVSWGLVMGINWHHRFWPGLFAYAGVGTHASLGLIGWFVQLVVSESYHLLPRFMNGRAIGDGRLRVVLALLNAAVVLLVAGALGAAERLARAGVLALAAAGTVYAADLWRFLWGTRGDKPDLTTYHWWVIWGLTALLAATGLAWAAGLLPVEGRPLGVAAGALLLLGWITLAIMGQLYKVTPFLMWHYRFARGMSALEVPRLPAPYYPRAGVPPFGLTVAGSLAFAAAVVTRQPALGACGGVLLSAGALGFWYLMAASWIHAAALRAPEAPSPPPAPRREP